VEIFHNFGALSRLPRSSHCPGREDKIKLISGWPLSPVDDDDLDLTFRSFQAESKLL
jgi:hypothetical protein